MQTILRHAFFSALVISFAGATAAHAQTVGAGFAGSYTASDLGSVTGLPGNYGGLTFLNNNTLLIGGAANVPGGRLYTVGVTRDGMNHITGFSQQFSI